DSSWVLPYNDTMRYSLDELGIYAFKMEGGTDRGLSLFNFGDSFPRSKTTNDLLPPLVYLTSSAEFRDLRMEPNRKLAIDNFWLEAAGNMDDARELIRVYYNRVLYSNLYFSSYKEGWKTDRGMIYMIFGPPDILEKQPDQEKWVYLTARSRSPVEFIFNRRENRFSYNNYVLDRKSSSTSLWAEAVNSWREGKIYSLNY
ncbi:MAG: GWxTD domain-containing protein, partial [Bacteroidota bacterium]